MWTTTANDTPQQQQIQKSMFQARQYSEQLSRRYEQLLRLEKFTDCVFHICDTQVKCHKLILSAASPVFEAMFYGALREHDREIEILDISPDVFKTLIDYIYIGMINYEQLSLEAIMELFYAADKYLLTELTEECLLAISHKLRFANILPALELTVYMNFTRLFDVCVAFFMRCCVNNTQYMKYLKEHYLHVSKECVKAIIAACKEPHKLLCWYVYEWTQQECLEHGLQQCNSALIIDELKLNSDGGDDVVLNPATTYRLDGTKASDSHQQQQQIILAERCYYKACRPFTVDGNADVWRVRFKCDRFISMIGVVLSSRLAPLFANAWAHQQAPKEYNESVRLDLSVVDMRQEEVEEQQLDDDNDDDIIWSHAVQRQCTKYNWELNINWQKGVVLTPDVLYELRFSWEPSAYGAEYPCSLQSCLVNGIKFIDGDSFIGSLFRGLRYVNLV